MIIEKFKHTHIESAAQLLLSNYEDECKSVSALPTKDYYYDFCVLISRMVKNNHGVLALQGNELVGFLSGTYFDSFKGLHRAVYCPIHAHGAKDDKVDVYQRMYESIADAWVKDGCLTHALTLFAHDKPAIDTWFHLGFGNMCVDAIRRLDDVVGAKTVKYEIRPATQGDSELLLPLYQEHEMYYSSSPLFMPVLRVSQLSDLNIVNNSDALTLIALDDGKPIAMMTVGKDDTTFVDEDEKTLHLKSAYMLQEYRGAGLGAAMLQHIVEWLRGNGYERCYVDYESMNRFGGRYWSKHFTPFAYSMFRKLDERILSASIS